jgi:hypothetical protein
MTYDDINRLYQQYLGRDASQEEAQQWLSGAYGATDPAGIEGQIASSGEAQARRSRPSGGPPETVPGAGPGYAVGGAVGGGGVSPDQIAGWYRQYLGRDASPDEIANWQNGTYGATDAAGIEGQIASSGEAQAHGGGYGGGGGTGVGGAFGGGGSAPDGGGNYWGAGTTNSPFGPWQGRFTAPTPQGLPDAPVFNAPTYTPPPAFSYGDFKAPSYEDAANDPWYQAQERRGMDQLQTLAAAKGTLNDSGTLKALIDYGKTSDSQQYQNVWNRDLGAYTTNRGNALDAYNTNYKTQYQDPYTAAMGQYTTGRTNALDAYNTNYKTQYADPYAYAYKAAQDAFTPQLTAYTSQVANTQHLNDVANTNSWNDYLAGWQDYEARRNTSANFALGS